MPISMGDVIVVGGDIGGLVTALAVARQRHRVKILQAHDSFVAPEAGMHLTPGALRALDLLGVGDVVRHRAVPVAGLRLLDGATGDPLTSVPTFAEPVLAQSRWNAVVRGHDLLAPLRQACWRNPLILMRPRSTVTHYEQNGSRVTAFLTTGERLHANALIGADGLCSPVRLQLTGDVDAVSRSTTFHTTFPLDQVPEALVLRGVGRSVTLWAGPDWQLVHYPTGGRSLCLSVTCAGGEGRLVYGAPVEPARVVAALSDAYAPARELVSLGRDWRMWVACRRAPLTSWRDRRVVLTGDAAWPSSMHAFPASSKAVEDALRLGTLMDCDAADFPQAFQAYAEHRDS